MSGWSRAKRLKVEAAFYKYLDTCFVNSKDAGRICLGKNLYQGQRDCITGIFDALEAGIHNIYILKSRQLGISTIIRALSIFWLGVHQGLKGALVFDTAPHKESARKELVVMLQNLPASLKFPKVKGTGAGNRDSLELVNESSMIFMSAGVKKSKSSGTLGRSEGLTMAHLSELCSYDNDEGLKSFEQSLSEIHPDRLYIYESTARGFNSWYVLWRRAKKDEAHCKCIFLGWWSKPSQTIQRDELDFQTYGIAPPTDKEIEKIKAVREQYGHEITPEQLAWVRRKFDPNYSDEEDADDADGEDDSVMLAEQAWTEEEAFQQTGAVFFGSKQLTDQTNAHVKHKAKTYMYIAGDDFTAMRVYPAQNMRSVELKVWEEPEIGAQYVMGIDPAFGENENNDRSSIEICRCYADGLDQVAEYAWPLITTRQFAWVIASLLGWYGQGAEISYILEINGPGSAVFNELKSLKFQIDNDRSARRDLEERGLLNVFKNVKTYIYTRPDAMGAGSNWHWECLALDTKLPTPTGWTTIGGVKAGDRLLGTDGSPCVVLGVSPVHINRNCYKLVFDDGSEIVADENHLWNVTYRPFHNEVKTLRTKELIADFHNVTVARAFDLPEASLPIDPYVLGVWLGDGNAGSASYFSSASDIESMAANLKACGYDLGPVRTDRTVCRQLIKGLYEQLSAIGLLKNKHIPEPYLRASYSQRLALLQGLMDTDGNAGSGRNSQQCGFSTSNERLKNQFCELLRSFGIKAKYCRREAKLLRAANGKQYTSEAWYQFWFTADPGVRVFRLERKQAAIDSVSRKFRQRRMHKILSVVPVKSVPVKCLEVDSPDRMFLVGEGMVPTHNTNVKRKILILERMRDFVSTGKLHIRSASLIEEMKTVAREGDSIGAPQSMRDDRVISMALAAYYWDTKIKNNLITQRRTREAEAARKRASIVDQVALFNRNHLDMFFKQKQAVRAVAHRTQMRNAWRYR